MVSDPLSRYIALKQQIAELEKELDELKESVFADVQGQGGQIDEEKFVIRAYKNPKYKFSESYDQKNTELKELKKQEIDSGVATIDGYSEYVRINFKKEKKED